VGSREPLIALGGGGSPCSPRGSPKVTRDSSLAHGTIHLGSTGTFLSFLSDRQLRAFLQLAEARSPSLPTWPLLVQFVSVASVFVCGVSPE
jgi:hypothetical protein